MSPCRIYIRVSPPLFFYLFKKMILYRAKIMDPLYKLGFSIFFPGNKLLSRRGESAPIQPSNVSLGSSLILETDPVPFPKSARILARFRHSLRFRSLEQYWINCSLVPHLFFSSEGGHPFASLSDVLPIRYDDAPPHSEFIQEVCWKIIISMWPLQSIRFCLFLWRSGVNFPSPPFLNAFSPYEVS